MASKFVFNLAALKKLRTHRLNIAKKEYLRIQSLLYSYEDQIRNLKMQREQTLGEAIEKKSTSSSVNGMAYLIQGVSAKINLIEEKIKEMQPDLERHHRWMVEASRDLKAIEILENKRFEEHKKEELRKEKRQSDQWASESVARAMARAQEEGTIEL